MNEIVGVKREDTMAFYKAIVAYKKVHGENIELDVQLAKAREERTRSQEALSKFKGGVTRSCLVGDEVWVLSTTGGIKSFVVESPEGKDPKELDEVTKEFPGACPDTF